MDTFAEPLGFLFGLGQRSLALPITDRENRSEHSKVFTLYQERVFPWPVYSLTED
jgi:hypothetical protein